MAKCLKNIKTKEMVRVSNDEASKKFESGKWKYTDKNSYIRYINNTGKENGQSKNK